MAEDNRRSVISSDFCDADFEMRWPVHFPSCACTSTYVGSCSDNLSALFCRPLLLQPIYLSCLAALKPWVSVCWTPLKWHTQPFAELMQFWQCSATMKDSFPLHCALLWALHFAWHHIGTVHPSGKSYCLTNLNNFAASLPNSLSRSSVPVFKDSKPSVALEGSHCHLWPWGKVTFDFHTI